MNNQCMVNSQVKVNVNSQNIKRGDIWFVDFGVSTGRIQGNRRPALIISNSKCNEMSPVITVVALTSNVEKALAKKMPTQVFISKQCGLQSDSIALCEQPRSIDKSQLDFKVGEVDEETMILIERATMIQIGIKQTNTSNTNNQVINVQNVKFDMDYAKELLLQINELSKISKQLNKPIVTLENMKVEFISYCKKLNKDHQIVATQIRNEMSKIKTNQHELVMA